MPTFEFRLRFNMLKGDHFRSENDELELMRTEGGQVIRLRTGPRGTPISKSSEIAIFGGPFSSESDARNVATIARAAVAVWAVKQRIGVNFGDGVVRSFLTDYGRAYFERERGHPIRSDRMGIDVYEPQEGLRFASTSLDMGVGKRPDIFADEFRQGMITPLPLSDNQLLAAELYGLSFFDMSFRSRFITLVTAVEAVLDPPIRSKNIQAFVDDMKARAENVATDEGTKLSISGSLERLKYDSIGQTGRALSDHLLGDCEYGGLKAGRFFSRCYKMRSEIVHNGLPSDSSVNLLQESNALQTFVGDLLLASFESASINQSSSATK